MSLNKGILKNMNLGANKEQKEGDYNEENYQRTSAKDELLKATMEKKYNNEAKYLKKKKKILKNNQLSLKEKKDKIKNLSKKILKRKSYYDKNGFNIIGKTLKKGINENRLGQRSEISKNINNSKTNILNLKYKLLYGFLDENEIEAEFETELDQYKKQLKKRQNIDFLTTKKEEEIKKEKIILMNEMDILVEKYSKLLNEDKIAALELYIQEIIPKRHELFIIENKTLEVIQDPNDEKIHYLYKK